MRYLIAILAFASAASGPVVAEVPMAEGLAAWDRIHAVVSHPRCTNCHVGEDGVPMWNALGFGDGARHGMNIRAGDSRIGAETVPCRTCHVSAASDNVMPHAPPKVDDAWRLPPVELSWLDKSSGAICAQLRDPQRNDGHSFAELAEHLADSAFVGWSFAPGGGRSSPPGSVASLVADVRKWTDAGAPCADDPWNGAISLDR